MAQRRVGDEPAEPGADDRDARCHAAYFTEPASRPWTKYRWKAKKTASGSASETNAAGAISSMFEPNWRSCVKIATVIGCVSRPNVSATSRSFHVQRNWKIASEAIAGQPERQDQAQEDPDLGGAVDPRRLHQVLRDPDEEVPQQEDRERQPEGGVEEDQAEHRVEEPEVGVEREDRDQRHLDRDDEHRDHGDEEPVAAGELEPGERVAGHRGDEDRQHRAADARRAPSSRAPR